MSLTPFAQKWVAALRSDKYKQGHGQLRVIEDDGAKLHCCLGVACELAVEDGLLLSYDGDHGVLAAYPQVEHALALASHKGSYTDNDGRHSLTGQNDEGKSFAEIADIIESEPEGLFRAAKDVAA